MVTLGDSNTMILMYLGINGGYSSWSPPRKCTQTCGGGVHLRKRKCNNPKPSLNGRDCEGPKKKLASLKWCNVQVTVTLNKYSRRMESSYLYFYL